MALKLKKQDNVKVISGKSKGQTGRIIAVVAKDQDRGHRRREQGQEASEARPWRRQR